MVSTSVCSLPDRFVLFCFFYCLFVFSILFLYHIPMWFLLFFFF